MCFAVLLLALRLTLGACRARLVATGAAGGGVAKKRKTVYPVCEAFLICDGVQVDRNSGKKSLIGLFDKIKAKSFPAAHPVFSIYIRLSAGTGQYAMSVRVVGPTGDEIGELTGSVNFGDDKLSKSELVLNLQNTPFPAAGQYQLQLWLTRGDDSDLIAATNLTWEQQ